MSSPASGFMDKAKQQLGPVLDTAAHYIDHFPKITGLALLAVSGLVILSMLHLIDTKTVMSLGLGLAVPMGIGALGLRYWLVNKYGKNKSTHIHTTLKATIAMVTIIGMAFLVGGVLSTLGTQTSFFDSPGISNIPIFGAVIGVGVLGSAILLAQCRNRLYRKILTTLGTIGYISSVIWIMNQFYAQESPYGAAISSILLFPSINLIQNMVLTWRSEDKEHEKEAIEMKQRKASGKKGS